jgi:transposase
VRHDLLGRTSENSVRAKFAEFLFQKLSDKCGKGVRWLTLRPMMSYPTDLSDAEFRHIEEHLPAANQRGRPRIHAPREILNALFYVLKSGCPWRLLPREFPPWRSVYHWFRAWRIDGTFERLNAVLRERLRARLGRNPQPSAAR